MSLEDDSGGWRSKLARVGEDVAFIKGRMTAQPDD